jgi:hypothetical protein
MHPLCPSCPSWLVFLGNSGEFKEILTIKKVNAFALPGLRAGVIFPNETAKGNQEYRSFLLGTGKNGGQTGVIGPFPKPGWFWEWYLSFGYNMRQLYRVMGEKTE